MSAWYVASIAFAAWMLSLSFICALCKMAAPSSPIEQKFDDDAQIEFLRQHRRH
jgi:hypothetical protein